MVEISDESVLLANIIDEDALTLKKWSLNNNEQLFVLISGSRSDVSKQMSLEASAAEGADFLEKRSLAVEDAVQEVIEVFVKESSFNEEEEKKISFKENSMKNPWFKAEVHLKEQETGYVPSIDDIQKLEPGRDDEKTGKEAGLYKSASKSDCSTAGLTLYRQVSEDKEILQLYGSIQTCMKNTKLIDNCITAQHPTSSKICMSHSLCPNDCLAEKHLEPNLCDIPESRPSLQLYVNVKNVMFSDESRLIYGLVTKFKRLENPW
ncbi:hypothetical protein CDAR_14741 [Caerostris darwini]|uniref:Vitellogenin n=1 Tax=Caerostris darwini TaxID=1538125 RepID=A0AAV4SAE8_9ARAC|nr:hypothetical protein CDAR_14741 [Caerostris darwini]